MPKFFTLNEAEGHLAEVERLVRSLKLLKQSYKEADAGLTEIGHLIAMTGGMIPPRGQVKMLHHQKEANIRGLKTAVEKIAAIGCRLKDLEAGLVDFPTLYRDREVYLCWKLGEPGIGYWHHLDDGLRGRRKIDGDFLKNHRGGEA